MKLWSETKRRRRSRFTIAAAGVFAVVCGVVVDSGRAVSPPARFDELPSEIVAFATAHCVSCHGPTRQESDLRLDAGATIPPDSFLATWENVLQRLEAGEMPPADQPRPPAKRMARVTAELRRWLERSHAQTGEAARPSPRRLNRVEYQTTVNELLGIELPLAQYLPEDGMVAGFDKVGRGLNISPVLVERYLDAADAALNEALSEKPIVPSSTQRFTLWDSGIARRTYTKNGIWAERDDAVVVWYTNDKYFCIEPFQAPVRGRYRIRVSAYAMTLGRPKQAEDAPVVMALHGGNFRPEGRAAHLVNFFDLVDERPQVYEAVDMLDAGHTFKLTIAGRPPQTFDVLKFAGPAMAVQWVEIEGPLPDGAVERRRSLLYGDVDPTTAGEDDADRILLRFAQRAFRRPTTEQEIGPYRELMHEQFRRGGTFRDALRVGLKAVLCAPEFLFLDNRPEGPDDYDVASRMSYFLWNAPPDGELLKAAEEGRLRDPDVRREQTARLLADPKSAAFTNHFLDGWLDMRSIDFTTPDKELYPAFDESLRDAMLRETRMFFDEVLRENMSVLNFIDSDFTIVNERLARHYGLADVRGTQMRKVSLPADSPRGGVMTQAAVLKVTADGTLTSPVLRGVWLLDRILGTPVPPPPPSVPGLEPDIRGATTIRDLLAKHRNLASCSSCHKKIDPPGFALESFDPIGAWREHYRVVSSTTSPDGAGNDRVRYVAGPKIDASDRLPDGRTFADVEEFKRLLLETPDAVVENLAVKLMTYALGREMGFVERAKIARAVDRARSKNLGLRSLIQELAAGELFVGP